MTIVSYGYTGAITPNVPFAYWQMAVGTRGYWVMSPTDCVVSPNSSGTNQVNISTGWIGANGIVDNVSATETLTLTAPGSGIQYYMIVAHRDWSGSGATTFTAISAGTSVPATLPSRNTNRGVLDDQPLAIVSVTHGTSIPAIVNDLRMWGGNERLNCFDMPVNYMAYNQFYGNKIRAVSGTLYEWALNSAGNGQWVMDPTIVRSGPSLGNNLNISDATGFTTTSFAESRGSASGNSITLMLQGKCSSNASKITFNGTTGGTGDTGIMNVGNALWQPPYTMPFAFQYTDGNASGGAYGGFGRFSPGGQVVVISGAPGTSIGSGSTFMAIINWTREP